MKPRRIALVVVSNLLVGVLGFWIGTQRSLTTLTEAAQASSRHEQTPISATLSRSSSERNVNSSRAITSPSVKNGPPANTLRGRFAAVLQGVEKMDDRSVLQALKALRHLPEHPDKQLAQQVMLARYGELDPETALSYVSTLVGKDYREGTATVLSAWTAQDPEAASAYFQENLDDFGVVDAHQKALAGTIASEWTRQDADAALDWAASLPPEVSGEAYGQVAAELVRQDPAQAVAALDTLETGFERAEMLESMVRQWAYVDPQAAAAWMLDATQGTDQLAATTQLMNAWMDTDPMSASTWLSQLENGPVKDQAIVALTQSRAVARDPEAAAAWSAAIEDPSVRASIKAAP